MRFEDKVYIKYQTQDQHIKKLQMSNKHPKKGWWEF